MLWFDEHLKHSFVTPQTPTAEVRLDTEDGIPTVLVETDASLPIVSVDVFYTQNGKPDETPSDRDDVVHRFWHHAPGRSVEKDSDVAAEGKPLRWSATIPVSDTDRPLWVYANVRYQLDDPVEGAGYYYRSYHATDFNLSSLPAMIPASRLQQSKTVATRHATPLIEDFQGDWQKEWFTYRPEDWARTTNKFSARQYKPDGATALAFDVRAEQDNELVVVIDQFAAVVSVPGAADWHQVRLSPGDFKDSAGQSLSDWSSIRQLKLAASERLKSRNRGGASRSVGGTWKGQPPEFRNLRWERDEDQPAR